MRISDWSSDVCSSDLMAESTLGDCRMERVRLTRGARTWVQTMKAHGAYSVLVSGGFMPFAGPVAEAIGFDKVVANELEIRDGHLTGRVLDPVVRRHAKPASLQAAVAKPRLPPSQPPEGGDGQHHT